ncbi:MAG TPA: NHL repeat-containing protein, partial [Bacteroidia bacterium]|nr:NHL repeat-containing protein [Bacteroidia bacterium]
MNKLLFCFSLLALPLTLLAQQNYTVSTMAGDTAGYKNGLTSVALFNSPSGMAIDNAGDIYVVDTYNNVIRKILPFGLVITFAGNDTAGYRDGASNVAEFNNPLGICIDKAGNVYVADTYNNVIRKISPTGYVSTLAGNDTIGYRDGINASAEFYFPVDVAADTSGNIYITDNGNQVIREISASSGMVSTYAGSGMLGYKNGASDTAEFLGLYGIALDDSGNVYVTEYLNNDVRKIRKGFVSTIAGNDTLPTAIGYLNGRNDTALFNNPAGIAVDTLGNVYVCDEFNNVIRKIKNDTVTTIAGNNKMGFQNGAADTSEFNHPIGIAMDRKGNFYLADNANNSIREISPVPPLGISFLNPGKLRMLVYPNPCTDKLIIASAPT